MTIHGNMAYFGHISEWWPTNALYNWPNELKSIVHNNHSTMSYLNHETDDVIL